MALQAKSVFECECVTIWPSMLCELWHLYKWVTRAWKGCAPKVMLEHLYKTSCVSVRKWHYYRKGVKGGAKWKCNIGIGGQLKHIVLQQLPKHKFTCWRLLKRRIQGSWRKQYTGGYEINFRKNFELLEISKCIDVFILKRCKRP